MKAPDAALDAAARLGGPEREELALAVGAAERAQRIANATLQPELIMPLAVQEQFGAFLGAPGDPVHECGMLLQMMPAMPAGHHEQCGADALVLAERPQRFHLASAGRRHIVQ